MKWIWIKIVGLTFLLSSCAVVNSPIRVAEEAATATIRTVERTAELGLEILDEPFDEEEREAKSKRWGRRKNKYPEREHH
ncbi:MAG: hypothetical protein ACI8UO_001662 [Verrucomicrobiales bacterium]|jgi:hypothetical protein